MTDDRTLDLIIQALHYDKQKNRRFPIHAAGQAGRVVVKSGQLMDCAMRCKYDGNGRSKLTTEQLLNLKTAALQVVSVGIRMMQEIDKQISAEHPTLTSIEHPHTASNNFQELEEAV